MFPPPTDEVTTPSNPTVSSNSLSSSNNSYNRNSVCTTTVPTATQLSQQQLQQQLSFQNSGNDRLAKNQIDRPQWATVNRQRFRTVPGTDPLILSPLPTTIQFSSTHKQSTPISTREKVGGDKRKISTLQISTLRQPNPKTHVEFDAEQHAEPQQNQQMALTINRTLRKIKNVVLGNNSKHRKHHYGSADKTNVTLWRTRSIRLISGMYNTTAFGRARIPLRTRVVAHPSSSETRVKPRGTTRQTRQHQITSQQVHRHNDITEPLQPCSRLYYDRLSVH